MRFFDVPFTDAELGREIQTLLASPHEEHRVIAQNLCLDHRVSPERAEVFIKFWRTERAHGRTLISVLGDFQRRHIRSFVLRPDFQAAHNKVNLINPPCSELCTLITTNHVWDDLKPFLINYANALGPQPRNAGVDHDLRVALDHAMRVATTECLRQISAATKSKQERIQRGVLELRHEPRWACLKEDVVTYANECPGFWYGLFGKAPSARPCYVFLMGYSADRVKGDIYWPTQLDVGEYVLHFPTPPCFAERGRTLCYGETFREDKWDTLSPPREVIHLDIGFFPEDLLAAGYFDPSSACKPPAPERTYFDLRARHVAKLQWMDINQNKEITAWFNRATTIGLAKPA